MSRLTRIEGIRPKHVAALLDAQIHKPSQLVACDDLQALSQQTDISVSDLVLLQEKARLEVKSQKSRYSVLTIFLAIIIGPVSFYATQWVMTDDDVQNQDQATLGQEERSDSYTKAYRAYQKNDLAHSLQLIEQGLQSKSRENPATHANFINLKGLIYDKQGEQEKALAYYQQAESIDPFNGYPTNNIGAISQQEGDLVKAESYYRQAIEKQPYTALFYSNLGVLLYRLERYNEAIENLQRAVEIEPDNVDDRLSLANAYLQDRQIDVAIEMYKKLLAGGKANVDDMNYNLGLCYDRLKDWPKAIHYYQKVSATASVYLTTLTQLAIVQANSGAYTDAIQTQRKALEQNPSDISLRNELANYLVEAAYYQQAIEEYHRVKIAESEPKNYIEYNLGRVYFKSGQPELATRHFLAALELDPNDAVSANYLGMIYHEKAAYQQALTYFTQAFELLPDEPVYSYNVGLTLTDLKKYTEAIEHLERSLSLAPEYDPSYNTLGYTYQQIGNFDQALKHYLMAIELNPQEILYQNNLTDLLSNFYKQDDAQAIVQNAINNNPDNAGFYLILDRLLAPKITFEQRVKALQSAVPLVKDPATVQQALAQLYSEKHDYLRAAKLFQKAAASSNSPFYFHLDAAYAFQNAVKYDQSLAEFNRALSFSPEDWYTQLDKGWLLLNMGKKNLAAAKSIFEDLIIQINGRPEPNDKWIYLSLATIARYQGEPKDRVFAWLDSAERVAPQDALVAFHRANYYQFLSDYPQALQSYQLALADPVQAEYTYNALCTLYYTIRNFSEYDLCLNTFFERVPATAFDHLLARTWDRYYRGDLANAVNTSNKALEIFYESPAFIASRMVFETRQAVLDGDPRAVDSHLTKLLKLSKAYPYYLDIEIQLVDLYRTDFRQNRVSDAQKLLQDTEKKFGYDERVQFELMALDYLKGRFNEAQIRATKRLETAPAEISTLQLSSLLAFQQGDTAKALSLAEKILHQSPKDALSLLLKGIYQIRLKENEKGKQSFVYLRTLITDIELAVGPEPWLLVNNKKPIIIKTRRQKKTLLTTIDDYLNRGVSKPQILKQSATWTMTSMEASHVLSFLEAFIFE